jgi:hypothetical protein
LSLIFTATVGFLLFLGAERALGCVGTLPGAKTLWTATSEG